MGRGRTSTRHALGSFALACFAVLLGGLSMASEAVGYTYVLRPDTTLGSGALSIVPGPPGQVHAVLDDALVAPTVPTLATDFIQENGNGPITAEVGYSTVALRAGENVVRTRSHGYLAVGDAR